MSITKIKTKKSFSSYIITETTLGTQCAEILLTEGHQVLGIVSNNNDVIKWALEHNIAYFLTFKEFEEIKSAKTFDYLFSIVNGQILSSQLLKYPRRYAINYHDAPLPKYAGVHATSWSILNNEKSHGISWHVMNSFVDEGDILKQETFPIESDDTALILNLKCYTQAIEAFRTLVKELDQGSIHKYPQDLQNRSYYGAHQKPENAGLVDWNISARDIDRLYRALYFGDYPNKLATFKVLIDQQIFFPHNLKILKEKTNATPGTLVKIHANGLQITTKTEDILIGDMINTQGNSCAISCLENYFHLHEGYKFPTLNKRAKENLYQYLTTLSSHEDYWIKSLLHSMPAKLPFVYSLSKVIKSKKDTQNCLFITSEIDKKIIKETLKSFKEVPFVDVLSSVFMIYLSRLDNKNIFRVDYIDPSLRHLTNQLDSFLSPEIFLTMDASGFLTGEEAVQRFIEEKARATKYKTYPLDIKERYPTLRTLSYDKSDIKINIVTSEEGLIQREATYLLEICIDPKGKSYTLAFPQDLPEVEKRFIETISSHIEILLGSLVKDPSRSIQTLPILTSQEKHQLLIAWNDTEKDYPKDKTIQALFEEQVERTPDNIAIVYEETKLTYRELNNRANQLAHYMRQRQEITPDTLICLCLDRSEHMLIGILAVLKAGGAYVPMDPSYPDSRIQYILEDTNTRLILTNDVYRKRLQNITQSKDPRIIDVIVNEGNKSRAKEKNKNVDVLTIDGQDLQEHLCKQPETNPQTETTSTHLAYIIYTSGTTGHPKGVMIEHTPYVMTLKSIIDLYFFEKKIINTCSLTNYVFDIFGLEYGIPILTGGTIFLEFNNDVNFLDCSRYDYIQMTPSLCSLKLNSLVNPSNIKIIVGGEVLSSELLNALMNKSIDVVNVYGPTETTIWSTSKLYDIGDIFTSVSQVSLGKPLNNERVYVLDTNLNPLPIGAIGELYIGGVGLARGYLNNPDLTAERFIQNPFQTEQEKAQQKHTRLYKTGDLVRWLSGGNLEYIGRNDFQVKIRGYRIELGEIETALSNYEGVRQSIVLAKEHVDPSGNKTETKYLVAYYVSESSLDEEKVMVYLQRKLPDYMIPSALVHLESLPLTLNGKLDRKALPDPTFTNQKTYVAPRNKLEEQVVEIWAEVLGLPAETVGIQDDFFRLGGNSILAIRLISKINKELSKNLRVASLFKNTSILKLLDSLEEENEENIITSIPVTQAKDQKLSFAQERLWFIEKYEEGTSAYNIPMIFKVSEDINLKALELSLKSIVERHEILRTLIKEDEGNAYQCVLEAQDNPLKISRIEVKDQLELEEHIQKETMHVYDLSHEYPLRISLYDLNRGAGLHNELYLSILVHHIAFDGWSTEIFLKELQEYYTYYLDQLNGKESLLKLPELSIQYKDFALWQRSYLTGERLTTQLNYWTNKLSGYETLNLTTDMPRPPEINYKGADVFFEIDEETSEALRNLAKELEVSLYSLLLSGYYLMLKSYSNQEDIVVGTPIANRHFGQIENVIGFFVNTLALRIHIDGKERVKDYIERIGRETKEAQSYQDLPFEKLIEELDIDKDTSRHPIFQVMFGVQNFGNKQQTPEQGVRDLNQILEAYVGDIGYGVAKFDLSTFIEDQNATLRGSFNYAESLYKQETIERFIETYSYILKQISELANTPEKQEQITLNDLRYLTKETYQQIVHTWNETEKDYPKDKTIQALFEEQVERTPDNIAIVYEETKLTYRELNNRANQLAHYMRERQEITPDTLICLCLDRSEDMLIGILAVLKAGGAYVPMDPSYPDSRIQYILEDTNTKLILTNDVYRKRLQNIAQNKDPRIIDIDVKKDSESRVAQKNKNMEVLAIDSPEIQKHLCTQLAINPKTETTSTHLAYVIYTSGTTGNPKGVCGTHIASINRFIWGWEAFPFKLNEICCQKTSLNFVDHLAEIFSPLLQGVSIVLLLNNTLREIDIDQLIERLHSNCITRIVLVPSLLQVILDQDQSKLLKLQKLKYVFSSGEELPSSMAISFQELFPCTKLINVYGSSEVSADVSFYIISNKEKTASYIEPIGKLISNTKAYVLDTNLNLLPIGAIGELYIGGVGLARGYLNQPELTKERFIPNPFQTKEEKAQQKHVRLYKTGDLVRWLSDGNLEYIGRSDFQVKIRGYRIELGEIESALSNYEGVKQSVVLAREHRDISGTETGTKYLIGYYVSESPLDEEKMMAYLQRKLPDYMIPSALVHLESLSLTLNGKLDRKALPDPTFTNQKTYVAPRNELEEQVVKIWAEVLGLPTETIGIQDDFFKLGGNSILAIRLVSRINVFYKSYLRISDIFVYKKIALLMDPIIQTKKSYKSFIKLNNEYKKPNMFMIHPGAGGCEVYSSLANKLACNFSCYGIDSYNLYNEKKIDNLNELARYYLSCIDEIMTTTSQKLYNLLGWSLGGIIALELASILEKRKNVKINVYLLDTILTDDYMISLYSERKSCEKKEHQILSSLNEFDRLYTEKIFSVLKVERILEQQKISSVLNKTQILLFKAMIEDPSYETYNLKKLHEYLSALEYNNIDKIVGNISNINLIKVNNAHHRNILDQEEILLPKICEKVGYNGPRKLDNKSEKMRYNFPPKEGVGNDQKSKAIYSRRKNKGSA